MQRERNRNRDGNCHDNCIKKRALLYCIYSSLLNKVSEVTETLLTSKEKTVLSEIASCWNKAKNRSGSEKQFCKRRKTGEKAPQSIGHLGLTSARFPRSVNWACVQVISFPEVYGTAHVRAKRHTVPKAASWAPAKQSDIVRHTKYCMKMLELDQTFLSSILHGELFNGVGSGG